MKPRELNEEFLDHRCNWSAVGAETAAYGRAANIVLTMAAEAFRESDDGVADKLRDAAREIQVLEGESRKALNNYIVGKIEEPPMYEEAT